MITEQFVLTKSNPEDIVYQTHQQAFKYYTEKAGFSQTINNLQSYGSFGMLVAGFLAEDAMQSLPASNANYYEEIARSQYLRAKTYQSKHYYLESFDKMNSFIACQRLGRLAVAKSIYIHRLNPTYATIKRLQKTNLRIATDLCKWKYSANAPKSSLDITRMTGKIAELAVLLLLNRFSIRELGDNSFLAIDGSFSEDHAEKLSQPTKSIKSPAIDVHIFVQVDPKAKVEQKYSLQIKSSNYQPEKKDFYNLSDVSLICVADDLALTKNEINVCPKIVLDCQHEDKYPSLAKNDITPSLDARTDLLLSILG